MADLASLTINPVGYLIIAAGIIGAGFSFWNYYRIYRRKLENNRTGDVSSSMNENVNTFFNSRYVFLGVFIALVCVLLYVYGIFDEGFNSLVVISLLIGAFFTAFASYFSQKIVLKTNEHITADTQKSYKKGFKTSFSTSTSVGLLTTSAVVLGLFINLLVSSLIFSTDSLSTDIYKIFIGFAAGVGVVSIFNRIGVGLFSQGAEMASQEIVDTHAGITCKSVYSPASNANDVGRIVANVGGASIDIFSTFTIALISALILGAGIVSEGSTKTEMLIYLPLIIASIGILSSLASSFLLHSSEYSTSKTAIKISEAVSSIILAVSTFFAVKFLLPQEWVAQRTNLNEVITTTYFNLGIFWSALIGIAASVGLGYITQAFTNTNSKAAKEIAGQSLKNASNNEIGGTKISLVATVGPILLIIAVGLSSYYLANYYGIAIAAVSFLANIALHQSYNTFATIAKTSNSVSVKSELGENVINTNKLFNKVGRKFASRFKVFLAVAASLSSLAMLSTFIQLSEVYDVNILQPMILSAALVGALIPFILSSNTIAAVKRIKRKIVNETNLQFSETASLKEANEILDKYRGNLSHATEGERETVYQTKGALDNKKVIKSASGLASWEALLPAIIALLLPVLFAIFGGVELLTSLILGLGFSSVIISIYSISKGNLMETAKNTVDKGFIYNGELISKESNAYSNANSGERAANPLREVVAPTIIAFMKMVVITALVLIPLLKSKIAKKNEIKIEKLSQVEYSKYIINNRL